MLILFYWSFLALSTFCTMWISFGSIWNTKAMENKCLYVSVRTWNCVIIHKYTCATRMTCYVYTCVTSFILKEVDRWWALSQSGGSWCDHLVDSRGQSSRVLFSCWKERLAVASVKVSLKKTARKVIKTTTNLTEETPLELWPVRV